MTEIIKNFVARAENLDSVILIIIVILLGALIAMGHAYYKNQNFNKAWEKQSDSLKGESNSAGYEITTILISIAMLAADKNAGKAIGRIEERIDKMKKDPNFFINLPELMEGINDNNKNKEDLNGDYAITRDIIRSSMDIIHDYAKVGTVEDFAELAVDAKQAKDKLSSAVNKLRQILLKLESHSPAPAE